MEFQQAVKRIHKQKYRNYNPQSLQNAYIEVMEKGMPELKARRILGVPRQKIGDRVKNIVSIDCVTTGRTHFLHWKMKVLLSITLSPWQTWVMVIQGKKLLILEADLRKTWGNGNTQTL